MTAAAPPAAEGLALRSTPGRLALLATVGASGMASLDATIVNVALPHIGEDLGAGVSTLQWVLTGYLVSLASLILLGGALGDRFGRRKVFVVGTVWFAAASLLCGLAPDVEVLVAARVLQGVGGALLTPGSLAILQASFREEDRALAVGAWSGLGGVAGAVGPLVGGGLVDGPGWRWAFLLNLPLAAAVVVCAKVAVPETRDPAARRGVDVVGAVLAVAALGASTWALTEGGARGWTEAPVPAVGAGAVISLGLFLFRLPRTRDPLVPPHLFRNRTFSVMNLTTLLLYAALGVTFFLVSYELQVAAGWSALAAGLALLPSTLMMLALSASSGALAQRVGPRPQIVLGPLLAAAGLALLSRIGPDASWALDVLPGASLFGLGLVTFVAPLTATVMAAADPDHVSVASGVNNAVARAASLTALAVVPAVSGLSVAVGETEVTDSYRIALLIAAGVAALAAPVAYFGLPRRVPLVPTDRPLQCPVDGTPIQPDPLTHAAPDAGPPAHALGSKPPGDLGLHGGG